MGQPSDLWNVRSVRRNLCGLYRGGARGDPEHVSDRVQADAHQAGLKLGAVRDGGREDDRLILLLFCWIRPSKILVKIDSVW